MENGRKKKLSTRLFWNIFCGILIPVAFLFAAVTSIYTDLLAKEVRSNAEKTLSYCWGNIEDIFSGMVTVSAIINNDSVFMRTLSDESVEYYDKYVMFNHLLSTIYLQNFGLDGSTWIHLEDKHGLSYCNQAQYPIVFTDDFITRRAESKGSICWDFSTLDDTGTKVFSMSRTFYYENQLNSPVATLTISIREDQLRPMLDRYVNFDTDCVLLYFEDGSLITGYQNSTQNVEKIYNSCAQLMRDQHKDSFVDKLGGTKYLFNDYTIDSIIDFEGHTLHMLILSDYDTIFGGLKTQIIGIIAALMMGYVLVTIVCFSVPKRLVHPILQLDSQVRRFHVGDPPIVCNHRTNDEIGSLYSGFYHLTQSINSLFSDLKEESAIKESYMYESLRAQINPHFLFNTLNSIKFSAQMIHAQNIVENIEALSKMLRYSMAKEADMVAFKHEIENIQNYLHIQNSRYGNSVELELDSTVKDCESNLVLKFILQPIVENCVLHGFRDYTDQGIIYITCEETDGIFYIHVLDNGRGFSEEALLNWKNSSSAAHPCFNGLGLAAIHKIIQITSGTQYGLDIRSTANEGTEVIFCLPIVKEGETEI